MSKHRKTQACHTKLDDKKTSTITEQRIDDYRTSSNIKGVAYSEDEGDFICATVRLLQYFGHKSHLIFGVLVSACLKEKVHACGVTVGCGDPKWCGFKLPQKIEHREGGRTSKIKAQRMRRPLHHLHSPNPAVKNVVCSMDPTYPVFGLGISACFKEELHDNSMTIGYLFAKRCVAILQSRQMYAKKYMYKH